jgi:hypothetical protein
MELRKFIATTIREYLNENIGNYNFDKVKLGELYIDSANMSDAYNKAKESKYKVSRTKRNLEIYMMLDGSKFLMDGHHRVADIITKIYNKNDILETEIKSNILTTPTENYLDALNSKLYQNYMPFNEWLNTIM